MGGSITSGNGSGNGPVRAGEPADAVDGIVPRWVAAPCNTEEIAALLRAAARDRLPVLCVGGGTSLCCGNVPGAYGIALQTRSLDGFVERRPEDMTITVEAGITIDALARDLASVGQRVAWDPEFPERATVGGVLASNSTGGLAYGFGLPRDLVLGMTVVDGRARTLTVGGRVVKNVAGYDLVRLFTGSHGTLGVIAAATLRTHPLPELGRTLYFDFAEAVEACAAGSALFASNLPLAALDLEVRSPPAVPWLLCIRVEGSSGEIAAQRDRAERLCGRPCCAEATEWRTPLAPPADADLVLRLGVSPAEVVPIAHEIYARFGASAHIAARLGDGTLRVSARSESPAHARMLLRELRALVRLREGNEIIERIAPELKEAASIRQGEVGALRLMRAIKMRFDPDGVLAPGRFVDEL